MKNAEHSILDTVLWTWFSQERRRVAPIRGPIIYGKALFFMKIIRIKKNEQSILNNWKQNSR